MNYSYTLVLLCIFGRWFILSDAQAATAEAMNHEDKTIEPESIHYSN